MWFMNRLFWIPLAAALACPLSARQAAAQATGTNPFFQEWKTPFGMPPFDQIRNEHFLPAIEKGIEQQKAEVQAIANNPEPPTFANTIEALDKTGELLDKVQGVFSNLNSAETNEQIQAVNRKTAPLLAALQDDVMLNEKLFARVKAVWEQRAGLKLNPVQMRLVEETYKQFVRGGANLNAEQKKRLREINGELSLLTVRFSENLLKNINSYRLVVDKQEDLAGLPPASISAAADAAKAAGMPGKWVFTLHAPSIWPFLTYNQNRELRRQILTAYTKQGDNGDQMDNKQILTRIAALRTERSKLMGYPTYANFVLEERMAKTPEKVYALLDQLWKPALAVAKQERASMQQIIDKENGGFQLAAWDWRYYAEKVKKARYDLDDNDVRPYLSLDNVRDGAFYVANKLYGLKFIERKDLPKYNPEVRTFEVQDADGSFLGVFMTDYFPRPGKRSGAWTSRFRGVSYRDGKEIRPIVTNVCNFSRPANGAPALLSPEETETLFHEFGHALHSLMSRVRYQSLSGVPRDFVELPSQIMENWAFQPEVVKVYAKHYTTGAPIPDELVAKIEKAGKFNQGFATVEYLAASLLDMDWHTIAAPVDDATAFERAALEKRGLIPEIPPRYRSTYFQHIFSSGYAAGYYSYIWSEVLDSDAFQAFKEKGLFDQATAKAFRTKILELGGTKDVMEMYKDFRGREPSVQPLLEKRGLTGTN
jgi:peptidyl-dipeptidase Dcp